MRRGATDTGCLSLPAQASAPIRRKSAVELQYSVLIGAAPTVAPVASNAAPGISGSRSAATSPVSLAAGLLEATPWNAEPGSRNVSPRQSASGPSGGTGVPNPSLINRTSNEAWVCPDDRQLALRAKLKSGWSIKTANLNQWKQPDPLSEDEHQKILDVITQAEQLEKAEQERVGRLVERLEGLRQSRLGNGETDCILCGEVFRFYHRSQRRCAECGKMTCGKCGLEAKAMGPMPPHHQKSGSIAGHPPGQSLSSRSSSMTSLISAVVGAGSVGSGGSVELIWLCKICHEQREIWKKSGAWFFKSMPKYALPEGTWRSGSRRFSHFAPVVSSHSTDNLGGSMSAKEDGGNSSEEDGQLAKRLFRRSFRGSVGSAPGVFANLNKKRPSCGSEELPSEDDCSLASTTISLPPNLNSNGQSNMYSFEVHDSDEMDNGSREGSRSRTTYPDYHNYNEGRSSSVPPSLLHQQIQQHQQQQQQMSSNGQTRIGSPVGFRGGRPPAPNGPRPPHWPPRALSPRYYRPPPGFVPRGPPRPGCPPPQWRGGHPPPPPFRPPGPESGSPPYSPRPHPPRRGGPPPHRGMRYPMPPRPGMGPPRFRYPYPPASRQTMPFSAPQSPVLSHRFTDEDYRVSQPHPFPHNPNQGDYDYAVGNPSNQSHFQNASEFSDERFLTSGGSHQTATSDTLGSSGSTPPTTTSSRDNSECHNLAGCDGKAVETGGNGCAVDICDKAPPPRENNDGSPPVASLADFTDEQLDEERELPRTFTKARPSENKFTSTLRRLSTVRKRNKTKRKEQKGDKVHDDNDESSVEVASTPPPPPSTCGASVVDSMARRPSSTTSRESEAEALTSGYFSRQESQSRGSDETLSSPRSPEGSHGLIEFSLVYNESDEHLLVNVIKAKKIKGTDINGLADSYCKITLLPGLSNKGVSQQITKTVAKSINPHYNAMLHFTNISREILLKTSIHAAILDEDLAGDHLLAEAKFPLKKILPQMQKKFQVALERPDLKETLDGLILNSHVGAVEISLAFYSKQGTLRVGVKKCLELQPIEGQQSANPVVQVVLHPGNKKSNTNRTTVKWNTLSPEFHEQFVYMSSITELPKQSLHISVWDKVKGRSDEYMGGIILGLSAKSGRLQHWAEMVKHPNQAHTRTHYLSANYID